MVQSLARRLRLVNFGRTSFPLIPLAGGNEERENVHVTNRALLGLIRQRRESPFHFLTKPASKPTPTSPPKLAPPVSGDDDLLAPPEENLNGTLIGQTQGNGVAPPKAPVALVNSTKMSPLLANSTKAGNAAVIDDELAKCKARAECFGISLAEPK
ncbi:hypothetical protein EDC04DRAFT_2909192 [Pisolithus marmoratus]|nr:hypothetical protein EDC04DRAFT_2909192 [Pisolithus marmoratus]